MQGRLSLNTTDSPSGNVAKVRPKKRIAVRFSGKNWVRLQRDDAACVMQIDANNTVRI